MCKTSHQNCFFWFTFSCCYGNSAPTNYTISHSCPVVYVACLTNVHILYAFKRYWNMQGPLSLAFDTASCQGNYILLLLSFKKKKKEMVIFHLHKYTQSHYFLTFTGSKKFEFLCWTQKVHTLKILCCKLILNLHGYFLFYYGYHWLLVPQRSSKYFKRKKKIIKVRKYLRASKRKSISIFMINLPMHKIQKQMLQTRQVWKNRHGSNQIKITPGFTPGTKHAG